MDPKWWTTTGHVLYYISLPVVLLAKLLYNLLYLLATPFIAAAHTIGNIFMFPVRVLTRIFTTFKALLIFLAFAVLLGVVSGVTIHLILKACTAVFKLDQKPVPKPVPASGHDAASYRVAREEKRQREEEKQERLKMRARLLASQPLIRAVVREARHKPISGPTSSPISPNTSTSATRSGLFNQTILEHTDEEDDSAF